MNLLPLISSIVMWVLIIINFVLIFKHRISGNLILLEQEGEHETYAFLELHEPIDSIKDKKHIRLNVELKTHEKQVL